LVYAGQAQRRTVPAPIQKALPQDDAADARKQWREIADQVPLRVPQSGKLMYAVEVNEIAAMSLSVQRLSKGAPNQPDQTQKRGPGHPPQRRDCHRAAGSWAIENRAMNGLTSAVAK